MTKARGRERSAVVNRGARTYLFRTALLAFLAAGATMSSDPVFAVYDLTDAEWAMLPEYCHHQGNVSLNHKATAADEWRSRLGGDFESIHHWCVTYVWMMRAFRAGTASTEGKNLLFRAEADTNYFLQRARPDSPIKAEAYTRLGEIYLYQNKLESAQAAFRRAQELDPARWQPYFLWAHHLQQRGRLAEARKVVASGLERAPNAKPLKSLLADLNAAKKGGGQ